MPGQPTANPTPCKTSVKPLPVRTRTSIGGGYSEPRLEPSAGTVRIAVGRALGRAGIAGNARPGSDGRLHPTLSPWWQRGQACINEAPKDENTVSFQLTSNGRFQEAREIITYRVERTKNQERCGDSSEGRQEADPVARLRDLADLREQGVLSEEEFQLAKERLLGQL